MNDLFSCEDIDPSARQVLHKIGAELIQYSAPVFILPSIEAYSREIIAGGTLSFVETPRERLLITAYHVWRRFNELKEEHPGAVLGIGLMDGVFDLAGHAYLDGDEDTLDLVILQSPPGALYFRKRFFHVPQWPIPTVVMGESVDVVGYTGADREIRTILSN